ncbi:MAG: CocE/NonD family hydrolase [Actinomycetota bacterium]|nr:CocE/NonD family hydrolase [Actinomycetota bacterium]
MRAFVLPSRRFLGVAMVAAVLLGLVPGPPAAASPTHYVTMSDGTSIAVNVRMPKGFEKGKRYPAIFEMSGYDGGSSDGEGPDGGAGSRGLTRMFEGDYVTVHASVRGTGCSSGEFDLFSWRSALDGREVVEWIADQSWSDGDVGIYGHSYGGITGFMVAATRPPHLRAVSVSGLIDDLYRGIVYPGGVSNYGFPLLWTGGVRPVYDVGGGTFPGLAAGDPQCAANAATHTRTVLNDPILQGLADTDNTWFQVRSLINYAERIEVPMHITGAYQDEQTGPRGPYHLFEAVGGVPKRLLMTNGDHGTQTSPPEIYKDRKAWLDHWVRGVGAGHPTSSVTTLFEMSGDRSNGRKESRTFPLEDTRWTNVYFDHAGKMTWRPPDEKQPGDAYVSGSPRQSWSYQAGGATGSQATTPHGPDQLTYRSEKLTSPTAVVGPITATLYMSSTAPDTEVFVQLVDEAPDGSRYYLQRGMLRASHRAIDPLLSDRTESGVIYRPHRPHTNPTLIEPNKVYEYLVEIFPLGHVFRPGHRLVVMIHTPPAVESYYAYVPKRVPGVNTLYHDADRPSHVTLPVVSLAGVSLGPEPKACSLQEVRCIPGG